MQVSPSWNRGIKKLFYLSVQTAEIVEVPLSRVVTCIPSIVFVFRVESQLELLSDVDTFVAEDRLEAPVLQSTSSLAVSNTRCDLIGSLGAVIAWPTLESARITPVRSNGVCNTLFAR